MTSATALRIDNDLLAGLPQRERDTFMRCCEHILLVQDQILSEPGENISHVYFPLDASISLLTHAEDHQTLNVGVIGSEDMLGATLILGILSSPYKTQVQGAGMALRMKTRDFQRVLIGLPVLQRHIRLRLYIQLAQIAQTAACAAFHVVESRLAYLLLLVHDRSHGNDFYLTHEHLARLLGIRRSGVTTAAGILHSHKLIAYTRGHVSILDRKGLEKASCSCYGTVEDAISEVREWEDLCDDLQEVDLDLPLHDANVQDRDGETTPTRYHEPPPNLRPGAAVHLPSGRNLN